MNNRRDYISILVTTLITAGLFLSVFHTHFIEAATDTGQVVIIQDFNECAICASHFKVSSNAADLNSELSLPCFILNEAATPSVEIPIVGVHNERAPPFFARG